MSTEISLDIETLSTHKNAVVASIGACRVAPDGLIEYTESDFYCRVNMQGQIDSGRHVDMGTVRFWNDQDKQTFDDTMSVHGALSPREAIISLRSWIDKGIGDEGVWTKGPAFDGAILESLAEWCGITPAWHFRLHRDIRTLDAVIEMSDNEALQHAWFEAKNDNVLSSGVHNALEDAKAQGRLLAWFWSECAK